MQVSLQRMRIVPEQARIGGKPHEALLVLDDPSGIRH